MCKYQEAAETLQELNDLAESKIDEIGYDELQQYLHENKLNNLYQSAKYLGDLVDVVDETIRHIGILSLKPLKADY